MSFLKIHPNSSIIIEQTLVNPITEVPVNDATLTGKILDEQGQTLVSSFTIPYVDASEGIYRITLAPLEGVSVKDVCKVVINATGTDSLKGEWVAEITVTNAPK